MQICSSKLRNTYNHLKIVFNIIFIKSEVRKLTYLKSYCLQFCTGHEKKKKGKKKGEKNGGESANVVISPVISLLQCTTQITDVWTITVATIF